MSTPELRKEEYKTAPEEIQDLYDSPTANALNGEMFEKYQIAEEKRPDYLYVTGDVILGFKKIADLPQLFQQQVGLAKEDALKLTADLTDAWSPIVEREKAEAEAKKDEVAGLAEKIAAIAPTPEEKVEKHEEVTPIRTMEIDAQKAHGYGAQQKTEESEVVKATPQHDLNPPQT